MVSKVLTGHSFYGAVSYVCRNESRAQILAAEGVRAYDYRLAIQDFKAQQAQLPSKNKACFHAILSFYPGENPGNQKLIDIANRYLKEIGMVHTQYVITKHMDKAHLHLHIIANLVNSEGKAIKDSWIGFRAKKAAQALTQEYGLMPANSKDLKLTNRDALGASEACRYQIFTAIQQHLPRCRNLEELGLALRSGGIEIQYKYKGETKERQGISFKVGNYCFKGSKIDRAFSLGNLEKAFQLQAQAHPDLQQPSVSSDDFPWEKRACPNIERRKQIQALTHVGRGKQTEEIPPVLNNLMGPQPSECPVPYDFTIRGAGRKKKKKSRRPGD